MLNQNTNANPNSNLAKHWNEQNIKLASFGNSTAVVAPIAANIVWAHLVIFLRLCRYESEPNGRVEKSSYFYPCNTLLWPLWLCHEHCAIITCAIKTLIKLCWYHADKTRFATLGKDHNYQWSLHWWRCKYHEAWNCDKVWPKNWRITKEVAAKVISGQLASSIPLSSRLVKLIRVHLGGSGVILIESWFLSLMSRERESADNCNTYKMPLLSLRKTVKMGGGALQWIFKSIY